MIERRRFSRIVYQAPATLVQESQTFESSVSDLSLHGLLLTCEQSQQLSLNEQVQVDFTLPDSEVNIQLTGLIVGVNGHVIRLSIENIDIESIGHLKRLVELNVGDDELLHRNIEHLSDLGEYT